MHIGEIINRVRKERRMTLIELSEGSGVALATLSRIENGKMTGTLKSHIKMSEALGLALTDLYKDLPSSKKSVEIKPKEAARNLSIHDKRSSAIMLAANVQDKKMMPLLIVISKGGQTNTEKAAYRAEKFVYILEGKIEANIGEEKFALGVGDTIYFDSSAPHHFKNSGAGEARLISVSCGGASSN